MAIEQKPALGEPQRYFTPGEFAKLFGVTPRTVRNWCDQGRIPFITTPAGHRRIPASAIKGGVEGLDRWDALQARLDARLEGAPEVPEQAIADEVLARRARPGAS